MIDAEAGGILPVARFENGDWIGRVIDRSGVDIALMHTDPDDSLPDSHRPLNQKGRNWLAAKLEGEAFKYSMWVYVRGDEPLSWTLLRGPGDTARFSMIDQAAVWEVKPPRDQRFFGVNDTPVRDAWLWFLLDVLGVELEEESWSKLQLPTVVPDGSEHIIRESDLDPEERESGSDQETVWNTWGKSGCAVSRRMARAIQSLTEDFFHMDRIVAQSQAGCLWLGRVDFLGEKLISPWTASLDQGQWTVYLRVPYKAIASGPDFADVLARAGVLVEASQIDNWLDTHARAGELVHDPEAYLLLDAPSPLLRPLADFRAWYRNL